ncbi:hypothetical protein [uncultured Mameliella sp.]|uniref:hypothetical protein n=1 Tax=uncultured Mameliella sp. TaxID=1447087 RepID=UPI00260A3C69|nr:hypothetical protein [uncultured Mameliella sp.]
MNAHLKILTVVAGCGALTGCLETGPSSPPDDGLKGSPAQFSSMAQPCIAQASRLTGVAAGSISVTDQIRTGGGPLLVLNVGGANYSCRQEPDGRVTVFSEFAN